MKKKRGSKIKAIRAWRYENQVFAKKADADYAEATDFLINAFDIAGVEGRSDSVATQCIKARLIDLCRIRDALSHIIDLRQGRVEMRAGSLQDDDDEDGTAKGKKGKHGQRHHATGEVSDEEEEDEFLREITPDK